MDVAVHGVWVWHVRVCQRLPAELLCHVLHHDSSGGVVLGKLPGKGSGKGLL